MTQTRREFIRSSAALGLLTAFVGAPARAGGQVQMPIGVGTHTNGGPLVVYMQEHGLIEAASEAAGIDVMPEFQDFQALLRMLQGVAAGQLHYGMLGSTPAIRLLATPNPAVPIAIAGGGLDFPVQVPADSPIRNMDDVRGKTVLTIVGSDLHLQWANMLKAHFGTSDAAEVGITMRNITAVTELWEVHDGIDAVVGLNPGSFGAEERGVLSTLMTNYGTTGKHYDGPEGQGAGHTLDWFKNAAFAPEAFYPHRIWWAVRQQFMDEHPEAVTAFLVANQQAASALSQMSPTDVTNIIGDHWPQSASVEARNAVVDATTWYRRGWSWITEGDAGTLSGLSEEKEIFETALSGKMIAEILGRGADVTRAAYEQVGQQPAMDVMTDKDAGDVRGLPQWRVADWQL
ncbi:ABC transporter substrate-binding protein [Sulfitobacter mediterraneus]|uniref:ABC transporter substrate-binding protein n=1 Tax=Sulfitobacter mediterraneus TaxID=83219 RepID=UPI0021A8F153|nr:ABC transporter substrate-binding protein [Sulfitobacter mediterraneus]UWR13435.1 ABC transporter substrate-binding protein [Sulfitobacter mediterraneus]